MIEIIIVESIDSDVFLGSLRLQETAQIHAGTVGDSAGVKHLYCSKNPRIRTYIFWSLEIELLYFAVVIGNLD